MALGEEDIDLPQLPNLDLLPELPELEDFFRPGQPECGICTWLEENLCKPYMTKGDSPRKCAEEIMSTKAATSGKPREERVAAMARVLEKYGINPNIRLNTGMR